MNDKFIEKCLILLKHENVKEFLKPILIILIQEIYPYLYLSSLFIIINFFLILNIFLLLWRNKNKNSE